VAAIPLGWVAMRTRFGARGVADVFPAEPLGILVFLATVEVSLSVLPDPVGPSAMLGVVAVTASLGFLSIVWARSAMPRERSGRQRRLATLEAFGDWPVFASVVSAGALLAVTVDSMGLWSVPLAGLPYLFAYVSLDRLGDTRRTYDQTIRALGAIPEASGQVAVGHSKRTADLAVAAGVEVGLSARELRQLEHAALLHDVGRLALANPALSSGDYSFGDVAAWSSAIIGEARFLEPVAEIVALQHSAYRQEGQVRDPSVPRASQLVRIAARYDSAVSDGVSPIDAVEALHKGAAYDYDPELVVAFRVVLERRGVLVA